MKILFLVHIEDIFASFFPENYFYSILDEIEKQKFDKVIGLFSYIEDLNPPTGIINLLDEEWEWSWGYEPEMDFYPPEDSQWLIRARGHEYTWVPPEIRNGDFKNAQLSIAGGCDSECLQDWRDVLDYVNLEYDEIPHLIW